jgi:hypothetical protein
MAELFTERQGQYLAFIHLYTTLHGRPPAEADFQAYFQVSAPAVHQTIVSLEKRGLIEKIPGQARSIRALVAPEKLPWLEGSQAMAGLSFAGLYPGIARWTREHGYIEMGYDYNTGTWVRAIEEGGMFWGGGNPRQTIEEWLHALEMGVRDLLKELEP